MGLFDKFLKSTPTDNKVTYTMDGISNFIGRETETETEGALDETTAMKVAALHQGINIITDTLASMPIYLYREEEGFHEVFYKDPRSRALSTMANEVLTSFNLKRSMTKDLILYGNAYAKIEENTEAKTVLRYIPTSLVTPKMDNGGYYFEIASYSTDVNGEKYDAEIVDFVDMICLTRNNKHNSILGQGLLEYASDVLQISNEENIYVKSLFRNGISAKALLSSSTPFKKEIKEQLKRDLQQFYSGSKNAGKMMVIDGVDISLTPLAFSPNDLNLLQSKKFTIEEIARFLNINKHHLNLDRGQGTYSNITQERLMLLQSTLMPYVTTIENELNKLLTPEEIEQGFYFSFDTSEMLKLTPEDQATYMLQLFDANIVNIEEVRATLGLGGNAETIAELKAIQQAKHNMFINSANEPTDSSQGPTSTEETPKEEVKEEKNTPKKEDKTTDKKVVKDKQK